MGEKNTQKKTCRCNFLCVVIAHPSKTADGRQQKTIDGPSKSLFNGGGVPSYKKKQVFLAASAPASKKKPAARERERLFVFLCENLMVLRLRKG
jgi:hypothetical protein